MDLSLLSGVTEQLQQDVLNHRLDGAFVTETDFHSDLVSHDVFQEELSYSISDMKYNYSRTLNTGAFFCFSKGCGYRARLEAWYKDQNIAPQKVMEFGTLETILSSVVVAWHYIRPKVCSVAFRGPRTHPMSYIPTKYSEIKTVFIRRSNAYLTTTVEKFIETIDLSNGESSELLQY